MRVYVIRTGVYRMALRPHLLRKGRIYRVSRKFGRRLIEQGVAMELPEEKDDLLEEKDEGAAPENKNLGAAPENKCL